MFYDGLQPEGEPVITLFDATNLQPMLRSAVLPVEAGNWYWDGQWLGDPEEHVAILVEFDANDNRALTLVDLDSGLALRRFFASANIFKLLGWVK